MRLRSRGHGCVVVPNALPFSWQEAHAWHCRSIVQRHLSLVHGMTMRQERPGAYYVEAEVERMLFANAWESNPPAKLVTPPTRFEDENGHRAASVRDGIVTPEWAHVNLRTGCNCFQLELRMPLVAPVLPARPAARIKMRCCDAAKQMRFRHSRALRPCSEDTCEHTLWARYFPAAAAACDRRSSPGRR